MNTIHPCLLIYVLLVVALHYAVERVTVQVRVREGSTWCKATTTASIRRAEIASTLRTAPPAIVGWISK